MGCDKKTPLSSNIQSQPENLPDPTAQDKNAQAVKLLYQGKLYATEEFQRVFKDKEFPVMVSGTGLSAEGVVHVFDSEDAFKTWTKTTPYAEKFAEMDKQIVEARQQPESGASSKMPLGNILTAGGSAILYEHIQFCGTRYPFVPLPAGRVSPNFGDFNDKASSLIVATCAGATFCILYRDINFNGPRYIFGYVSASCYPQPGHNTGYADLRNYPLGLGNWNDNASSMIVL